MPALLQVFARLVALKRLGVLLFVLAATLCASSNASALGHAQPKTRVWVFDFAEHNSSGLLSAASSGKHQGNRVALSELASGSLLAAEGAEETVSLFRAVEPGELADIGTQNAFRNPFGIEVKYFSTTAEGAAREAEMLSRLPNTGPFSLVQTSISRTALGALPAGNILLVDGGVSTVVLGSEHLSLLSTPLVLPW